MKKINWTALIIAVLIPVLLVGGGSALATMGAMSEYGALNRPPLSPPGWLFPVVWTILFILMGIASYLVWESTETGRATALTVYGVQLAVNFLWSIVFFRLHRHAMAVGILVVLWILIIITMALFSRFRKAAAWLLLPYLLWVSFAAYLNIGVAMMN